MNNARELLRELVTTLDMPRGEGDAIDYADAVRAARAYLAAPDDRPPREATEEMIEAGSNVFLRQGYAFAIFARDVADAWQAMYDASPTGVRDDAPLRDPMRDAVANNRRVLGMPPQDAAPAAVERDAPPAEVQRLRELEHHVWHMLDDSCENVSAKRIEIELPNADYDKVCELLGDQHPLVSPAAVERHPELTAQINALPQPLRHYVIELETVCDPAGTIREVMMLRDRCKQLEAAAIERPPAEAQQPQFIRVDVSKPEDYAALECALADCREHWRAESERANRLWQECENLRLRLAAPDSAAEAQPRDGLTGLYPAIQALADRARGNTDDARNAKRYRHLRDGKCLHVLTEPHLARVLISGAVIDWDKDAAETDAIIDAAIAEQAKEPK